MRAAAAARTAAAAIMLVTVGCGAPPDPGNPDRREDVRKDAVLRVCSDPDNLPYSNDRLEGFENRLAEIVAGEMGAQIAYTWWPQRRGFLRNTLNAGQCDVVMGLPADVDMALTTRPYYRSSYAFVSRRDRLMGINSFDDERLRRLRVGVQLVGDDGANAPPAHALSRRGLVSNVVGFPVYDDPSRIVRAVADGAIDLAVVWGPVAGYYALQAGGALDVLPVDAEQDLPHLPLAFDMSMAVRKSDHELRDTLDMIVERQRRRIDAVLIEYGVPLRPEAAR